MKRSSKFSKACFVFIKMTLVILFAAPDAFADCGLVANGSATVCEPTGFRFYVVEAATDQATAGDYRWEVALPDGNWQVVDNGRNSSYPTGTSTITISTTTTYRVVYTLDGGNCQGTETFAAVVIEPPATPTATHGLVCGSGATQVSVTPVSGATYEWYYNSTLLTDGDYLGAIGSSPTVTINGTNVMTVSNVFASVSGGLSVVVSRNQGGCNWSSGHISLSVTRHALPGLSIGSNQTVCINSSSFSLGGSPAGGTWTGPGVSSNTFNPSSGGAHLVKYTYTDVTTGCSAEATKTITVSPNISFPTYTTCASNPAYELINASPAGGTWSGSNVSSNGFFNANAGVGSHSVTYTVTEGTCTASKATAVVVTGGNTPAFPHPVSGGFSCGGSGITLSVDTGGTPNPDVLHFLWLDDSNVVQTQGGSIARGASFNTGVLSGPKSYTVIAVWSNGTCISRETASAEYVNIDPPVTVDDYNCSDGNATVRLAAIQPGYTYEWTDSEGNAIPAVSGVVTYNLSLDGGTLDMSGISTQADFIVKVRKVYTVHSACYSTAANATAIYRPLPVLTLLTPASVCYGASSPVTLSASPDGGSWFVNGNAASSSFTPSANALENQTSTTRTLGYTFTDSYGCTGYNSKPIEIKNPAPPAAKTFLAEYDEVFSITGPEVLWDIEYRWYTAPTGGSPVAVGNNHTTPTAVTSQQLYYLSSKTLACEGTLRGVYTVNTIPNNHNFIREEVMLAEGVSTTSNFSSMTAHQKSVTMSYIDGLGRPAQTVQWQASPDQKDIVQPVEYDVLGRESRKYLPYASQDDNYWHKKHALKKSGTYAQSDQAKFYSTGSGGLPIDTHPFAETEFESSPLNRVAVQGAPGAAWASATPNHAIKKEYGLNDAAEVYQFVYNDTNGQIGFNPAAQWHASNTLHRSRTIDEHGNDVIEFADMQGRTVCKKVFAEAGTPPKYASTYYIYDDFGSLMVVIPPEGLQRIIDSN